MSKAKIIISIIALVLVIFLGLQNQQLKEEKASAKEKVSTLQEKDDSKNTQVVYSKARDVAEKFIRSYYVFEGYPEKKVLQFVTDKAKDKLFFGEGEKSKAISKVSALNIYYGDTAKNRQEIFATFDNEITFNEVESTTPSYIKLDMIKKGEEWKVDNLEFTQ